MGRYIDTKNINFKGKFSCGLNDDGILYVPFREIPKIIEDVPTANVEEVKYGKWIKDETEKRDDGEIYDYCCSLCKSPAAEGSYSNHDVLTPYCPICGAKMDEKNSMRKIDCSITEDEYNKGLNDLREGARKVVKQLSKDDFIKNNCHNCGTQRCGGPDTEWFEGCSLKDELKKEE